MLTKLSIEIFLQLQINCFCYSCMERNAITSKFYISFLNKKQPCPVKTNTFGSCTSERFLCKHFLSSPISYQDKIQDCLQPLQSSPPFSFSAPSPVAVNSLYIACTVNVKPLTTFTHTVVFCLSTPNSHLFMSDFFADNCQ